MTSPTLRSLRRVALLAAAALALAWAGAAGWQRARSGLLVVVAAGDQTRRIVQRTDGDLDRHAPELRAQPDSVTVQWQGVWRVDEDGRHGLRVRATVPYAIVVDGRTVLEEGAGDRPSGRQVALPLTRGAHALTVRALSAGPGARLRVRRALPGESFAPFAGAELLPSVPSAVDDRLQSAAAGLGLGAIALVLLGAIALGAEAWQRHRNHQPVMTLPPAVRRHLSATREFGARFLRARGAHVLAAVAVLYGGALRAEALVTRYGPPDTPAWAHRLEDWVQELRPSALQWLRVKQPYAGEDPSAYLRHARAMTSFYEPRYREPGFVFAAKLGVLATGGRDVGISVASATASTLLVGATYLLGAATASPVVGLVAAAALAIDERAIALSSEGWRDDMFALLVTLFCWHALRLHDRGRLRTAIWMGLVGGLLCLTRITGFSVVVPVLLLLAAIPAPRPRGRRLELITVAAALVLAVAVPFMVSCWITYGDPLHSINGVLPAYHEAAAQAPMNTLQYLGVRLAEPWQLLDTVLLGFTSHPFLIKWNFGAWAAWLRPLLAVASVVGLWLFLLRPRLWLLLVALIGAVAPFAFTWNVGGGGAWRLTVGAYPFYLVASGFALSGLVRLATSPEARATLRAGARHPGQRAAAVAGALAAIALAAGACVVHPLRVREEVTQGGGSRVMAGPRDALFFVRGWYPPVCAGDMCFRYSRGPRSWVRLPLVPGREYDLELRLDPLAFAGMPPQSLVVKASGQTLARLSLGFDPARTGSYRVRLPAAAVEDGTTTIELEAAYARKVGEVDAADDLADEDWVTAFIIWYVRVGSPPATSPVGPAIDTST